MIVVLVFLIVLPVGAVSVLATSQREDPSKLVPNCLTLRASQAAVIPGSSGVILFTCGHGPALTVGRSQQFRPVFTLPTGYTGLKMVRHAPDATDCNDGPFLVSGHPLELGPGKFD